MKWVLFQVAVVVGAGRLYLSLHYGLNAVPPVERQIGWGRSIVREERRKREKQIMSEVGKNDSGSIVCFVSHHGGREIAVHELLC